MDYLSFALRVVPIKLEKGVSAEGKELFDFIKQWWTCGVGCNWGEEWDLLENQIYDVTSSYGKTDLSETPFVAKWTENAIWQRFPVALLRLGNFSDWSVRQRFCPLGNLTVEKCPLTKCFPCYSKSFPKICLGLIFWLRIPKDEDFKR